MSDEFVIREILDIKFISKCPICGEQYALFRSDGTKFYDHNDVCPSCGYTPMKEIAIPPAPENSSLKELREYVDKYIIPPTPAAGCRGLFNVFGYVTPGICEVWKWNHWWDISEKARLSGSKPIEDASREELIKLIEESREHE